MRALLAFLLALSLACPAAARELKIATWNLNWLTARPQGDPILPPDVHVRASGDVDLLAKYAKFLDADVVAIEEVDGPAVAARLFPPDRYVVHMTGDHVVQRVGFAIRRGIAFTANPDLAALDPQPDAPFPLRSGADVTLHLARGPLRLLAVHLKSGCWEKSFRSHLRACETLKEQLPVLQDWIAARQREGVAYLVLGDFNRRMLAGDQFLAALERVAPLAVPTSTMADACWGEASAFIDHVIVGGPARSWLEPNSLQVLTYRETDPAWKDRLSDHCPVSLRFDTPG
jgi:endonuclease/exonuclease/phosphatase family metal-dependent hydrolase